MDTRRLFGQRLRLLRRRAGLTQQTLAVAARLSAVSISNIERGTYAPAFCRLRAIAKALQVDIHELFVFEDYEA